MKPTGHKYLKHILWWAGLYIFWIMVFQRRSFAFSQTATIEFCYLLFIAANFYFNISFAIPRFLYKQLYIKYSALFLSAVLVTALLRVPLALFMNATIFLVGRPQPTASALFVSSFVNIAIWSALIVAAKIAIDRFRVQQYVEQINKEKSKTELDFLNAQLNPHFLFNSLHSIYGHIDKNNSTARNMLLTFSDMLRYQLYDCTNEAIDIDRELDYIKNYVALQRSRKEEDLVVNFHVDKNVKGLKVAPLLFICFVENAFKYVGVTEEGENRIDISLSRQEESLLFKCLNTKDPIPVTSIEHKGIGIENTRRRLNLYYPDNYSLDIQENKDYYFVKLKVETDALEMHYSR